MKTLKYFLSVTVFNFIGSSSKKAKNTLKPLSIIGLGFAMNYILPNVVNAQEVGVVIDSIECAFGNYDESLGPAASRIGGYVWELDENDNLKVKDTLDFGDMILYKRGDPNEYNIIYGGKQDLVVEGDGIDSAFVTLIGRLVAPDGTPRVKAGVSLYNAYSPRSSWNNGDLLTKSLRDPDSSAYSGDGSIYTDNEGRFTQLLKIPVRKNAVVVGVEPEKNPIPDEFILKQNYPNPFNPSTTIKYSIPNLTSAFIPSREGKERSDRGVLQNIQLKVYDILGREITTLVNKKQLPGNYSIKFDTNNLPAGSSGLTSGIYFYRLEAGSFVQTKKMILLR